MAIKTFETFKSLLDFLELSKELSLRGFWAIRS